MNRKRQKILKKIQRGYIYCSVEKQKGGLYYTARLFFSDFIDEVIISCYLWVAMAIVILWV